MVSQAGSQLREKLGVEAVSPAEAVSVRAFLPSNPDGVRFYSEGLAQLRVFDALEARDLLQHALASDPKFSLAHSALAEAWSRLGYDKKAQQEARQAYDLSANLSREQKLVVEGRYRDINHEYEKATEVYRTLFTLFPDNLDYGLKLAAVQFRRNPHEALATVESLRKLAAPASEDPRIDLQETAAWRVVTGITREERDEHEERSLDRAVKKAEAQGPSDPGTSAANAVRAVRVGFRLSRGEGHFRCNRDREHEGSSLRAWADVIARTDVPEAIRLYQQAETIFRRNGSEPVWPMCSTTSASYMKPKATRHRRENGARGRGHPSTHR